MMFLGGSALRICQRQTPEVRENLEALQHALRQAYVSPHRQFLRRQELNNRTQGPLESLESYLDDVDTRAARLQLSDAESMQCFVQGLRQDLKEHVILQLPETYAAAVDAARLKNSLLRSPTSHLADQASRALATLDLGASARTPTSSSSPDSQYVTRQEFMKWQNQLQSAPQNYSPVGPTSPPLNSYNLRNRRTTDGRPICNNCNRVGHVASRCFANSSRQPFLPNRSNMPQFGYSQRQSPYNQRNAFSYRQQQYQPRQYNYQGYTQNPRFNQNAPRPTHFPALPPPRAPPPPPLHAISEVHDDGLTDLQDQFLFRFARYKPNTSHANCPVSSSDLRKTYYLTVSGEVQGVNSRILIDTGSAITAINQELWDTIKTISSTKIQQSLFTDVRTASGEIVTVWGASDMNFNLGNSKHTFKTHVVPKLNYAAIIGKDFLQQNDCVIDFKSGYLKISRDNIVPFLTSTSENSIQTIAHAIFVMSCHFFILCLKTTAKFLFTRLIQLKFHLIRNVLFLQLFVKMV